MAVGACCSAQTTAEKVDALKIDESNSAAHSSACVESMRVPQTQHRQQRDMRRQCWRSLAFQPMWQTRLWRKTIKSILKIRWHSTSTCKGEWSKTRQQRCNMQRCNIPTMQHCNMQQSACSAQQTIFNIRCAQRRIADRSKASKRTTVNLSQSLEQRPSPLVRPQHRAQRQHSSG